MISHPLDASTLAFPRGRPGEGGVDPRRILRAGASVQNATDTQSYWPIPKRRFSVSGEHKTGSVTVPSATLRNSPERSDPSLRFLKHEIVTRPSFATGSYQAYYCRKRRA